MFTSLKLEISNGVIKSKLFNDYWYKPVNLGLKEH